ncbi:hypothetical protein K239x_00290 [Planctomycetes bacterium K23_9]|uniref:Vitamin K-dependent gamma-carboxylase n=2 Tax=Stieleria marina TaxID=1930275 RepID=A0A517NLT7_9BACT|nr:hypothetical protein K239x_00290 [Planctomycetes bacterium K23_9]
MLCVLLAATYRLWIPNSEFPPVAMFRWAAALPDWCSWIPLTGTVAGALWVIAPSRSASSGWWLVALSLSLGFVLDQHRLQPWAYQSLIYGCVFATMRPVRARQILIPLAASVYIYSAAGKLDYQFVHSVGQDFLNVPLGWLGLQDSISPETKATLAHVFPITELVLGVMLLVRKTRCLAGYMVIGLHASLIVMLGPWSLNHSHGVLLWNVLLIVQAWFLFAQPGTNSKRDNRLLYRRLFGLPPRDKAAGRPLSRMGCLISQVLVVIAIVMPATERAGLWDHWTSWALYSPHSSRTSVEFHRSCFDELPDSARKHLKEDADDDGWQELALDDWSLEELSVPVYPQARYQLALAYELATLRDIEKTAIRCKVRSAANRISGRREEQFLLGLKKIDQALNDYWLVPR